MNPAPCIVPVLTKILDCIQRHANYVVYAKKSVEKIKNKKNDLVATKADLDGKIEDAGRRLQKPSNQNQVVRWQEQVAAIIPEIEEVVRKYETRACFWAICSDYKTGHRCADKIEEVDALLNQGSQYLNEQMVVCDNSIVPISLPYVVPGSLDSNFAKALDYIKDDNSKINVIGIWGPGGVGKTTLLAKIYNSWVGNNAMFGTVIRIVASKEQSNVTMIQQKIVEKLHLAKRDDVQSQADIIYNYLIDQNFLLFMDDLWGAVELSEVGVPDPYEEECGKRRKVIFTTRSLDVCGNMEAKEPIKVDFLTWEDSWLLFKKKVGNDGILSDHRISKIAEDVAKECKGLPLALKTIGRAMSQKKTLREWKSALDFMKKSQAHNVPGLKQDEMLLILKLSYDYLDGDALKKCFLTISMWPEDFTISKKELIECWMGLDIIDNFEDIDGAYQIGHSLLERLLAASLLENGDEYDDGVKMHDVVRDLALWIASDCGKNKNKWLVEAGIQLQEASRIEVKWSEAEYISLMENYIKELPSSSIPNCPRLLTLMLKRNHLTCESILSSFHKFQSLKYLDLSRNRLGSFPESICDLPVLQCLNLSYNNIEHVPEKLGNLKKLKYLVLRGNRISNVPRGVFSELAKLLVLDMFIYFETEEHYSMVNVEELKWLEKKLLYLGINVWGDEAFNKLLNMSVVALSVGNLHMTSFNFMSIIPNRCCLKDLAIGHCRDGLMEIILERNDIHKDLPSINLESFHLIRLSKLERIIWKDIEPKNLFVELKQITILLCNLLDDISWIIHLPSLRDLVIGECDNMRIAMNNEDKGNNNYEVEPNILTFPSLRKLTFSFMSNLEKISTRSLAFPELGLLQVSSCPLLKTLLPVAVGSTPKLRMIEGSKEWWDNIVEWEDDDSRSHFSQLFRGWNEGSFG